ncbi:H-NS histone family protein [Reyranella sp.]|uniref:H-NS histone family protein n=1 Tax=Reyranella sp. TaxID=1929291 RepID=UPI001221496E|nr:H-NS histone family protein [Reyranella sp.]TAJ84681.1 MAG: H-NS histone family protein [Reyranella sp.]
MKSIRSMSFEELVKTRAEIEAAIDLHLAQDRQNLMAALKEVGSQRSENGKQPRGSHALKGRKLPPLYRNPKNRSETWAGRGNRPRWLSAALKQGKKLESFSVR